MMNLVDECEIIDTALVLIGERIAELHYELKNKTKDTIRSLSLYSMTVGGFPLKVVDSDAITFGPGETRELIAYVVISRHCPYKLEIINPNLVYEPVFRKAGEVIE